MQEAARIASETAITAEQHYVIPNWKCAFSIGLSQYFTFFPAKLKGNSVSTSQMKHRKLTWK